MTLRQTIQAAPAKASELITKLSATTNNAVKTREGLFSKLSNELARYLELEEQHLLPLLRKRPRTKVLAAAATQGHKSLRTKLATLEAAPKDTDEFLALLSDLSEELQQHIRTERKELLPAVMKVLSDGEARDLTENIASATAEAERAERQERHETAMQAKLEAEAGEQAAKAERAAAKARKATERKKREATQELAETIEHQVDVVQEDARQAVLTIADHAPQGALMARTALATPLTAASEMHRVWTEWFGKAVRANAETTKRLFQCRSVTQVAELQKEMMAGAMRNWMDSGSTLLELAARASPRSSPSA